MRKAMSLTAAAIFLLGGSFVQAQYTYTPPVFTPLTAINMDVAYQGRQDSSRATYETGVKETQATQPPPSSVQRLSFDTRFNRSTARTSVNLARFVAKSRSVDPSSADQLAQVFASTDIIGQMSRALSPYGLNVNDVADAYTVYWINAWEASRGIVGSVETRDRVQAVRAQALTAISAVPALRAASEAEKQEFAEAMFIQAALISAAMEAAASDPAKLRAVSQAAGTGANASGLDLSKMELTTSGFVFNQ
jgi:hypothetical protein